MKRVALAALFFILMCYYQNMSDVNIDNFLDQFSDIIKKYTPIEDFNVFHALRLDHDETRLHSRFITNLLNPYRLHGMGDTFLKKFLTSCFSENSLPDFNYENVVVKTEFPLGKKIIPKDKNEKINATGGSLDILIESEKYVIGIENKINAGDQSLQLRRYYNSLKKIYSQKIVILLYLTPTGKDPSSDSLCELNCENLRNPDYKDSDFKNRNNENNVFKISYKDEILDWLEESFKYLENKDLPKNTRLKQAIDQYIEIINNLVRKYEMLEEFKIQIQNPEIELEKKIKDLNIFTTLVKESEKISFFYIKTIVSEIIKNHKLTEIIPAENDIIKLEINDSFFLMFKYHSGKLYYGLSGDGVIEKPIQQQLKLEDFSNNNSSSFKYKNKEVLSFSGNNTLDKIKSIKKNIDNIISKINSL